MNDSVAPQLRKFAGSIGLLLDRSVDPAEVLATVWLLDHDRVATCAHTVLAYSQHLHALKIVFPANRQERGITSAYFHPRFNRKTSSKLLRDTITDAQPVLPLQKYNAVVLVLSDLEPLTNEQKSAIGKALTLKIPSSGQGMSGNLADIDLALVIQTVLNARKEGTIVISDDRNRPIANLFCASGRVLHARYRNLTNELALFQMFEHQLPGHFSFQSASEPDWPVAEPITRPTDMLLIEAHRRYDELVTMLSALGGRDGLYCHAVDHPDIGILPAEIQSTASDLWQFLDGTTKFGDLWKLANADDYVIFKCLTELFHTRQIEDVVEMGDYLTAERKITGSVDKLEMQPLPLAPQMALSPLDTIASLSMDYPSGRARVREGSLLGALRAGDPWHLVHNIRLLPQTNGSPLFKGGFVIGMHCGVLRSVAKSADGEKQLQQMLWIESITECLKEGGEAELARKLSDTGDEIVKSFRSTQVVQPQQNKPPPQGCVQAARIDCPKCGNSSLESARFCKRCGERLILDADAQTVPKQPNLIATTAAIFILLLVVGGLAIMTHMPNRPDFVQSASVILPDEPWISLSVNKYAPKKQKWVSIDQGTVLNKADRIYVGAKVLEPCYFYLLERSATSDTAQLAYPDAQAKDKQLVPGTTVAYPENYQKNTDGRHTDIYGLSFSGPAATEMLIAVASHQKLDFGDDKVLKDVFKSAISLLERGDSDAGIEVDAATLSPSLVRDQNSKETSSQSLVYLERLPIRHAD